MMDKNDGSNAKKAYATMLKTQRDTNPTNPTSKLSENYATLRDGPKTQPNLLVQTAGAEN